jgi:hypothetical protein
MEAACTSVPCSVCRCLKPVTLSCSSLLCCTSNQIWLPITKT